MSTPMFTSVGKKKLKITRAKAGSYVGGRWQDGETTTAYIWANVQPVTSKNDVLLLPEGDRTRPMLKLYSACPIKMSQEGEALRKSDKFTWTDGFVYEVNAVHNYEMGVLDHYKAIATRVELS